MEISRRSKLLRWAYLLSDKHPHTHQADVNLCNVFWRTIVLTPLKLAAIGAGIGFLFYLFVWRPVVELGWVGLLLLPGIVVAGGIVAFLAMSTRDYDVTKSAAAEWLHAKKRGYCPLIRLKP